MMDFFDINGMTEDQLKDMLGQGDVNIDAKKLCAIIMSLCCRIAELRSRVAELENPEQTGWDLQ